MTKQQETTKKAARATIKRMLGNNNVPSAADMLAQLRWQSARNVLLEALSPGSEGKKFYLPELESVYCGKNQHEGADEA